MGNERLGWDQTAPTAEILASLRFVAYVDGVRADMREVECSTTLGSDGFPCTGRLPAMTAGRHALQLASIGLDGDAESALSEPLQVIVLSATSAMSASPAAGQAGARPREVTTVDRVRLRIESVMTGLSDPTDVAFLPDGRLVIAERAGTIRVVDVAAGQPSAGGTTLSLSDVDARGAGGLLGVTADPEFGRNGYIYAAYTAADGFRVARFRESAGTLADRVILLGGIRADAGAPAATIRFGPDAALYFGVDDGGQASRAGDLGSYNGKILRLNRDGTTPPDQPGGSPIFASDVNAPRGMDWTSRSGLLWLAQMGPDPRQPGELRAILRAAGKSRDRARVGMRYLLPQGITPSQFVIYRGDRIPAFRGDLLMAAGEGGGLLRVRFDANDPLKVVSTERLFDRDASGVRAIAVAPDGTIYLATATALSRISP